MKPSRSRGTIPCFYPIIHGAAPVIAVPRRRKSRRNIEICEILYKHLLPPHLNWPPSRGCPPLPLNKQDKEELILNRDLGVTSAKDVESNVTKAFLSAVGVLSIAQNAATKASLRLKRWTFCKKSILICCQPCDQF